MVCVTTLDELELYWVLPLYWAKMLCLPSDSVDVVSVATPLELSVPEPMEILLSRNVTVPVGVLPGPVTVAVKVTAWPKTEGFWEDRTLIDDAAFPPTVCTVWPVL